MNVLTVMRICLLSLKLKTIYFPKVATNVKHVIRLLVQSMHSNNTMKLFMSILRHTLAATVEKLLNTNHH